MQTTRQAKRGFTLVELLVVIAIIGILAAVGIQAFAGSQGRARDAKRKTDLHQITDYLLTDYLQHASIFPLADPAVASGSTSGPAWLGQAGTELDTASTTIGFAVPQSPNLGATGTANDYWYVSDDQGTFFAFWTKLEAGSNNWFVINSKGYSDEVADSSAQDTTPAFGNTECLTASSGSAGILFSPCSALPVIATP